MSWFQEIQEREHEARIEAQAEYDEKLESIMEDGVTQEVAEYMIEMKCCFVEAEIALGLDEEDED